jgi:glycosyltransferase involved in cell wall biosynthesis
MNVLYLAPYDNFGSRDAGYGNASNSLYVLLKELQTQKFITNLDAINFNSGKKITLKYPHYDIAFVVTNPNGLLDLKTYQVVTSLLKTSEKKYLNILWETLPLPRAWNFLLNSSEFTGFTAPSYFLVASLLNSTRKPVYYLPYYLDETKFPQINVKQKMKENIFSLLFIGQNTIRKGIDDAIIAYCRTFSSVKDTQLIVKGFELSRFEMPLEQKIKVLAQQNMSCKNAPIFLLNQELSSDQMSDLYLHSSALVFPSRGEGFGLPPAEAMLVGLPIAYTNWSALPDVCESPANIPLPYMLDEAVNMFEFNYDYLSYYAYPNRRFLMKSLYAMYKSWKDNREAYYQNASQNRQIIIDKFGKDKVTEYLKHFLSQQEGIAPENLTNHVLLNKFMEEYKYFIPPQQKPKQV